MVGVDGKEAYVSRRVLSGLANSEGRACLGGSSGDGGAAECTSDNTRGRDGGDDHVLTTEGALGCSVRNGPTEVRRLMRLRAERDKVEVAEDMGCRRQVRHANALLLPSTRRAAARLRKTRLARILDQSSTTVAADGHMETPVPLEHPHPRPLHGLQARNGRSPRERVHPGWVQRQGRRGDVPR
jgi:hypothetical protein